LDAVAAATDADQRIKERVLRNGVEQSKLLHCLVPPEEHNPARQMSIKWQLYSTRDYVCLDATGFTQSPSGARLGYHLSHSIAFDKQLPRFERYNIDRGKRSVCFFYRQYTPTTVELYARGFFDFEIETASDPVFSNVAQQVIANQWLANARIVQLSQMKKLACQLKQRAGRDEKSAKASKPLPSRSSCNVCSKSTGFLGSVRACGICTNTTCSRCSVKKLICAVDAKTDEVVETSKPFCTRCIQEYT
jgi:hypothetical protein